MLWRIQRRAWGPDPPPPGKSQVAICFLRNTGTDPLEKQLNISGPVASRGRSHKCFLLIERNNLNTTAVCKMLKNLIFLVAIQTFIYKQHSCHGDAAMSVFQTSTRILNEHAQLEFQYYPVVVRTRSSYCSKM